MTFALRRYRLEALWVAVGIANYSARMIWPSWETIPLDIAWFAVTATYVLRVWPGARRTAYLATQRAAMLERQQRFMHDVSHELRTPVTIARGRLELLLRGAGGRRDVEIALDELSRVDEAIGRLLLLASAEQDDFLVTSELELEPFLEETLMRWSGAAPRAWRIGPVAAGTLRADGERVRIALDALLENAVKYSPAGAVIELRARYQGAGATLAIEIEDGGFGVPAQALERIFERFGRAEAARTASAEGVGLGLAIVDAIAKRHGGRCTATSTAAGSTFALHLPGFTPAPEAEQAQPLPALS